MIDDIELESLVGKWICFRYCDDGPSYTDIGRIIKVTSTKIYLEDERELKRRKTFVRGVLSNQYPIN